MEAKTYEIPVENIAGMAAKMQKLVRRFSAKGIDCGVELVELRRYEREFRVGDTKAFRTYAEISLDLTGDPKLGGWKLAAALEFVGDEVLVCGVPGVGDIPTEFRSVSPTRCDHCKADRRRSKTFVLVNDAGEFIVVGRSCLADFLGHNPEKILFWAQFLAEIDDAADAADDAEAGFGGSGADATVGVEQVIAAAARLVAVYGFRSRAFEEDSTVSGTISLLFANDKRGREFAAAHPVTDESRALASEAMAVLAELAAGDRTALGDYLHNLAVIMAAGRCPNRRIGLLCSAFSLVERARREREAKAAAPVSVHIGSVGERLRGVEAEVFFTRCFDGAYGTTELVKMRTPEGSVIQWWSSSERFDRGDRVVLDATVKAHETDEYLGGAAVTVVTRGRVKRFTPAAGAAG